LIRKKSNDGDKMTVQTARKIPFDPVRCPDCRNYYAEINRCRAYAVESWPRPILGIFSGESIERCEKYLPDNPPPSSENLVTNPTACEPATAVEAAPAPQPLPKISPPESQPIIEPRIHCPKCNTENPANQMRCSHCRVDLLPGEGLVFRLLSFVLLLLLAGFFGRFAYLLGSDPSTANAIFDDPIKLAFIAIALFASSLWILFRKTPLHSRYINRADRHLALNPNQALLDYTRAIETAPQKERAEILRKRASAYEKMGLQEEASRDLIAYTYEQGAYAFGSNLTGLFGGSSESYVLSQSKAEQRQLLEAGRAIALGYCPRCKDAIQLTSELLCPTHGQARINETRLFVPSDLESGREQILKDRLHHRFSWLKVPVRLAILILLVFALIFVVKQVFVPGDTSSEAPESMPALANPPIEEVIEETFQDGGISFSYPSDWEIVTSTDRQELLHTTLKGIGDYDYIGGVFIGDVNTCETCAHMVLVTVPAPEEGPLTQKQYEQIKAETQNKMGARLLDHQLQEFDGIPVAVSKYIGLSRETQQWDVILLVPGEKRAMMFSCSAHRDAYVRFEPVFIRAMETLTFEVAPGGLDTTAVPLEEEVTPAANAVATVDRSGSSVNVRSGAGTQFGVIGGLPRNSEVEVLGRNQVGDWLKIAEPSGWIYAELVSVSVPVDSLPVILDEP
jgi:hypothetical protein